MSRSMRNALGQDQRVQGVDIVRQRWWRVHHEAHGR
jgi:hypothetical protein